MFYGENDTGRGKNTHGVLGTEWCLQKDEYYSRKMNCKCMNEKK